VWKINPTYKGRSLLTAPRTDPYLRNYLKEDKKGQVFFFHDRISAMHLHVDVESSIDPVFLNRSTQMVVTEVDREAVSVEVSR